MMIVGTWPCASRHECDVPRGNLAGRAPIKPVSKVFRACGAKSSWSLPGWLCSARVGIWVSWMVLINYLRSNEGLRAFVGGLQT